MYNKIFIIVALVILSSISIALNHRTISVYTDAVAKTINLTNIDPTEGDIEGLKYMREEEKLARDVYREFYTSYKVRPFKNIPQAEETHMDLVKDLLTKFNIEDPVKSDTRGEFTNQDLSALYKDLVEKGKVSLTDALKTGALIEETDISDLNKYINATADNDIKETYIYLKYGSENHLRAFVRNLESNGITYEPVKLTRDEYDNIIKSIDKDRKHLGNGYYKNNGKGKNCQGYNCPRSDCPRKDCIWKNK